MKPTGSMYYGDYLGLDQLLSAQHPESERLGIDAHDELLFIIIHQAYELWFKQIMHELESILKIFQEEQINDNSPALQTVEHRLGRMVEIWKLLVAQVKILETMTPMDFLDFRDLLNPASGFQSYQFRILEARLGLKMETRHQNKYYQQQLRKEHLELIEQVEGQTSLFECLEKWLSRMPFVQEQYWKQLPETANEQGFWAHYRAVYQSTLRGEELQTISLAQFDQIFSPAQTERQLRLSPQACQGALFIMLYRGYPLLQTPFKILDKVLELDELMATWRYRHMIMVRRMIGARMGTGGSSGAGYLKGAMENHHIFGDFAALATFLVPRQQLPQLSPELQSALTFQH